MRRRLWLVAVPLGLVALWAVSQAYVSRDSRTCVALYRAARTAADTARVDSTLPAEANARSPESHSCGFIRRSARWF